MMFATGNVKRTVYKIEYCKGEFQQITPSTEEGEEILKRLNEALEDEYKKKDMEYQIKNN